MQFKNKLTFNIVPIPITFMEIANITQIGSVSTYLPVTKKEFLLREYLILVIEGRILQIYNIISMKLIMEIEYEPGGKKLKKGEQPLFI